MDITCKQSELKSGLAAVSHAVSNRSTLPILANVLLTVDAQTGQIQLSATNLELAISCRVPARINDASPSAIAVPARLFSEFISSLSSGEVQLVLPAESLKLQVSGLRSKATIQCQDAAEFPSVPVLHDADTPVVFSGEQLKEAIHSVAFAAADDESRPVLTGIFIHQEKDGRLVFAAADSFCLAVYAFTPGDESQTLPGGLLIPARALTELARILPEDETVEMVAARNQVLFHTTRLDVVSRLIEGTFPPFRSIIPESWQTRAVLNVATLGDVLKSTALFARSSSNILQLLVAPGGELGNGYVQLDAASEDVGDGVSSLDAAVTGEEMRMMLNYRYLADVLSAIRSPNMALELSGSTKPVVLRPLDIAHEHICVVMPMYRNR
jgi:DNA polymerase-3 subunit beta